MSNSSKQLQMFTQQSRNRRNFNRFQGCPVLRPRLCSYRSFSMNPVPEKLHYFHDWIKLK